MKFRIPKHKKIKGAICGAKLRNSNPARYCKSTLIMQNGRCRLHGGKTPKGELSPHYKNGIYSAWLPATILEKMDTFEQRNPLDLLPELNILRGLLAVYLNTIKEKSPSEYTYAGEITIISELIAKISTLVDKVVRIRNDTSITISELKLVAMKMAEVSAKYIPDEQDRSDFLKESFESLISRDTEQQYIENTP